MKYKEAILKQSLIVYDFILETVRNSSGIYRLPNNGNKLINEGLISIYKLAQNLNLAPQDKILLEKAYGIAHECVYSRVIYFGNFLKMNGDDKSYLAANVSIATMYSSLLGAKLKNVSIDSSTDHYFLERMPRLLDYLYPSKNSTPNSPALYTLFNLGQTLSLYVSLDYEDKKAKELLKKVFIIQQEHIKQQVIKDFIESKPQLDLFYKYQWNLANTALRSKKDSKFVSLDKLPSLKLEYQLRILSTLANLNETNFIELFEENFDSLNKQINDYCTPLCKILFLRCIAEYYTIQKIPEELELDLKPFKESSLLPEGYLNKIFSRFDEAMESTLEANDLNILLGYNDAQLRDRIANIVLIASKNDLLRERKKPHGVFEVSDMEIQIKIFEETYFLCMPFKTALEIKTSTVPEIIGYQIFRPFIHYDNVILIFITAKRCSQNLINNVKKMHNKLKWNIAVIENEELARLLKLNNQLH